jgi:DsbC/DsbD-like thiol-disulfide interchange protein
MTIPCKSLSSPFARVGNLIRPIDMVVSAEGFCQSIRAASFAVATLFCLGGLPAKADPFASTWSEQAGGTARMRLIAAGFSKGVYDTAVEIKLDPKAVTYWRLPGEAGVPPQFSFSGSENVAKAEVLYPAPNRLDEGGIEAFGYRGGVTFPIRVTPRDATKPSRLDLALDYAVCERICVPAKGHAELLLPKGSDSPERATVLAAEARVPSILPPAEVAKNVVTAAGTGTSGDHTKPHWSLIWKGAMPAIDLFAEGPDGWAFETHKTAPNSFSVVLVEMPDAFAGSVSARLTLTGADKAYEFTLPLAVAKAR